MLGRGDAAGHCLGDRAGQVSAPYGAPTALTQAVTARRARLSRRPPPPTSTDLPPPRGPPRTRPSLTASATTLTALSTMAVAAGSEFYFRMPTA